MNDAMRLNACRNMLSICKPDGFIGVVDESLTYKQYVQYRVGHLLDQTPVAIESYLDSVDRHTRLFGPDFHCIHKEHASKEIFYSFYGTKRISKKNSSTQPSSNDDSVEFQLDYSEMKTVIKQGSANAADFERVERIAEGGMGVVYKAFQKSLHRFVALKVLKPVKANEHAKQRFQFEAIAAAKLHHNNIVQVFALTEWESQPTIVMEYVDGPNLEQYARNKKLPVEEIVRLSLQISRAVEHAHENNIIHRDLKPMNILITREGVPKVADFGIAKAINANIATSRGIKGTWAYISPEMALQKECGPKADVYGIGGILYFLLTSQPPFRDEKFHELFLKLTNPNEKPIEPSKLSPRVPIDLEDICMGCLDKDADKRKSPGEVTAMLERCLHHA
jgi:serine/threonine protein kinase